MLSLFRGIKQVGLSPRRFVFRTMADEENSQMETDHVESQDPGSPAEVLPSPPGTKKPAAAKSAAKAKPAAKTVAKAKAATKALAKGKPGAKAASMKVLKKPASAKPPPVQKAIMKKPASSKAKPAPSTWKHGSKGLSKKEEEETQTHAEQGEEEEPEDDPTMEIQEKFAMDPTTKDRSKDFKFKQLLVQNTLPKWLKDAYQKTLTMKTGRVAEQRRLVNLALDRKPDGALVLSLDKPELRDVKDNSFTCEYFSTLPQKMNVYISIYF